MENIGKLVKELRIRDKLSADQLAEKLGKTNSNRKQYVYDIEAGRIKRIDIELLANIAEVFKVPMSHFLTFEGEDLNSNSKQVKLPVVANPDGYWKEKYDELMQENSNLKSQIIKLMEKLTL